MPKNLLESRAATQNNTKGGVHTLHHLQSVSNPRSTTPLEMLALTSQEFVPKAQQQQKLQTQAQSFSLQKSTLNEQAKAFAPNKAAKDSLIANLKPFTPRTPAEPSALDSQYFSA